MATMDQAVWANVNVTVEGEHAAFARGALLPEPATAEEASERTLLRLGGALRTVEVVYTQDELADMARARGDATAAREAQFGVDPDLPMGDQMSGTATTGVSTMVEPSGSPVVIGNEEMRAEHAKAAKAAQGRRDEVKPPAAKAPARDTGKS